MVRILFLMLLLVSVNSYAQSNNVDSNINKESITKDPDYVGKSYKEVMDAEVGNVVFKGLNCYPYASFTLGNKNEYVYQSCSQKFDGKFKYFVFQNGIYENTIDSNEFEAKRLLNEKQKQAKMIEEERRAERQAENEERARIIELKNKTYSKAPANYKLQIQGSNAILITSTDNDPFLLERIVINNRVGEGGCDVTPNSNYMSMRMGDLRTVTARNCGDSIVKIDVFTNRGNSSYKTK